MLDAETVKGVESDGRPISARIAERMILEALSGDHKFIKEILDRTEGSPKAGDPLEGLDFSRLTLEQAKKFRELFAVLVGR